MIIGGIYMLQNGIVVYSNILGKAAQFSFIAALILSFWHKEFVAASLPLDRIILWIAVALALVALVDYALDAAKKLKAHKAGKQFDLQLVQTGAVVFSTIQAYRSLA